MGNGWVRQITEEIEITGFDKYVDCIFKKGLVKNDI